MSWEAGADLVVVGAGAAGLTAALRARELGLRVLVITKEPVARGNTGWAQGGVAVVDDPARDSDDSIGRHVADTLAAGAGLCARQPVESILRDGARAVRRLRTAGARFDTGPDGSPSRTREGGHSAFRVIHAGGDATGAEVQRALSRATADDGIPILRRHCVADLLRADNGAVRGVLALDPRQRTGVVRASSVLLATGGLGQLYAVTTNPEVATADGIALALRAGASVADLEFVQFHPTALHGPGRGRRQLITEAVRGEGAVLVDGAGQRVMAGEHPAEDLAPRDVVSATITRRIAETDAECVYLDATGIGSGFAARFPTVFAACRSVGIDPSSEPIPVSAAAHYSCGGIMTTVDGQTGVSGLYAAGEVARTGLHGANRLASNSLLEGLVMGTRAAETIASEPHRSTRGRPSEPAVVPAEAMVRRDRLQDIMSRYAGIGRTGQGLREARAQLDRGATVRPLRDDEAIEDASLTLTAQALLTAAAARAESRGCHRRTDHPDSDDVRWLRSIVLRLDVSGWLIQADPSALQGVMAC